MTAPGGIRIPITADGGGFDAELARVVMAAMKGVQAKVNAQPIRIAAKVDFDAAGITEQAKALRERLQAEIRSVTAKVDFDAGDVAARAKALHDEIESALRPVAAEVHFDDSDVATQAKALHARLEEELRPITQRVRVETEQSTTSHVTTSPFSSAGIDSAGKSADGATESMKKLGNAISSAGTSTGKLAGVTAILAAIGGAAGAAAGLVAGLGVGLAAVGTAGAAIGATALVGLSGIKDAIKAANAATEHGPAEAQAAAERVKALSSAQDRVADTAHSAQTAQRALADSHHEVEQAAKALADAEQKAGRNIEDAAHKARGATISQKEAAIDLREAQKEANDSVFNPAEHEQALVKLERAQLTYDEAVTDNTRAQKDNAEAHAKGVEGADAVVAAKDKQNKAAEAESDAAYDAAKASRDAAEAVRDLAEEQKKGTPAQEKLNEAMSKLSPNAQEVVRSFIGMKPALVDLKNSVQDTTFANLGANMTEVSGRVIPALKDGMNGVAGQINGAANAFVTFLGSAQGISGLQSVFAGATNFLKGMSQGTGEATQGMLSFVHTAEPAMQGLGQAVAGIGDQIGKAFSDSAKSGQLSSVFAGLTTALQGVGPLLNGLVSGLLTIADKVLPSLGPLFASLGQAFITIAPALGDIGKVFADTLTSIMPQLAQFISALVVGLQPVLPVIGQLLSAMMTALTPLIGPLSQIAVVVGQTLAQAITALAPALGPLATAFASIVTAVAPLIPLFAQSLSAVLQALAPALTQIANALAPVITMFAAQMQPVIEQLAPVLAQVAGTIGTALAQAIQAIAPVLPPLVTAFANLIVALLPLLPVFADMAVKLLPPLIGILVQLAPVIVDLINAFTWLVKNVLIPILIPVIQQVTQNFQDGLRVIGDAIGFFKDIAKDVFSAVGGFFEKMRDRFDVVKSFITEVIFPAIGGAIDKVKSWFDEGIKGITTIWDKLKEAASVPVKFVVNTIWNEGLRKAWNTVAHFLPGVGNLDPVVLGFRSGGDVSGPGSGTSDDIPALLSDGEHVVTAAEVASAGGQNVVYAIRDMIARGIPFKWDGGRIITDLGRDNLDRYGAAVKTAGIGNVSPEGMFDRLRPRYRDGGAVTLEPWMYQLQRGHQFARAQDGRPYQWGGPRFEGDSYDCSGFMSSIAAVILGEQYWPHIWGTGAFGAYPQVGAQGFVKGLTQGSGFGVGITNAPGTDGGGHTAGELRGIPELGIAPARVESGGALGDVHYGRGTDPNSFASFYGLPIGANGFFQPAPGGSSGGSVGPSTGDQHSFLAKTIKTAFEGVVDPIRRKIDTEVGPPPPDFRKIPGEMLHVFEDGSVHYMTGLADGLTDGLSSAWSLAKTAGHDVLSAGHSVLSALNPFDDGGVATGTGFLPKNIVDPERVLSPEQTRLFDALVVSLGQIAGGSGGSTAKADLLTNSVFSGGIDELSHLLGIATTPAGRGLDPLKGQAHTGSPINASGQIGADTVDLLQRTQSDAATQAFQAQQAEFVKLQAIVGTVADKLGSEVLGPVLQSAFAAANGLVQTVITSAGKQVVAGTDRTTAAIKFVAAESNAEGTTPQTTPDGNNPGKGVVSQFGQPGSAFDAVAEVSKAVQSVAQSAQQAFSQVAQQIANAALAQQASKVGDSRGQLGKDISGGLLVDMIIKLTGVEIDIRDNLIKTTDAIKKMRGDNASAFDTQGRIVSDTADLMQRNQSSAELVVQETNRINQALIKSVLRYLMTSVLIPIITSILSAMITLVVTAIGAAIGSVIPGIGTAIGAAVGAVVGAALAGVAAVVVSGLAVGAGAAIDSFDDGGLASGIGYLPKNIIAPERVLSPTQTRQFDQLVNASSDSSRSTTIHAPVTVYGGGPDTGAAIANDLLSLLPA